MKDQIKDLKEKESLYNQCKEELLNIQGNLEEVQAQYDQLLLEYTTLQEEYEALQKKYEELEAKYNTSVSNKKTSSSSGSNSTSSSGSSEEQQDKTTVYWVPKGKKYHSTKDCVSLKRSDTILSGSISKVGSKTKCNLCW